MLQLLYRASFSHTFFTFASICQPQDARHGKFDFKVPRKYRSLFEEQESLPWRRRNYERHAFLREVLARAQANSAFGIKYQDHLKRHGRAIKQIKAQKSVKSIADSQYFVNLNQADEGQVRKWIFRLKVMDILRVFFACYA